MLPNDFALWLVGRRTVLVLVAFVLLRVNQACSLVLSHPILHHNRGRKGTCSHVMSSC